MKEEKDLLLLILLCFTGEKVLITSNA